MLGLTVLDLERPPARDSSIQGNRNLITTQLGVSGLLLPSFSPSFCTQHHFLLIHYSFGVYPCSHSKQLSRHRYFGCSESLLQCQQADVRITTWSSSTTYLPRTRGLCLSNRRIMTTKSSLSMTPQGLVLQNALEVEVSQIHSKLH